MPVPLVPACAYQGGKQRLAASIVDVLWAGTHRLYADLCCGSGAIAIELVNRGVPPAHITMVDQGPWGLFWREIGAGTYSLAALREQIAQIPTDPAQVEPYIHALSRQPVQAETAPYVFILLQAASFGSKAIWIADGRWQNCSFRRYWLPTATSHRRSPVNPMMPMPGTLYGRVAALAERMVGVRGVWDQIEAIDLPFETVSFVDPPYCHTTAYGHTTDILAFIQRHPHHALYVSEGRPLSTQAITLAGGRSKGGISGERKQAHEEWLTPFLPGE